MIIVIAVLLFIIACGVAPDFMAGLIAFTLGLLGLALMLGLFLGFGALLIAAVN